MKRSQRIKYVQIQTQSACNANCVFCPWIESWHKDNPGQMSTELFISILDQLKPYENTLEKICLYLMQEPFIDPRIFDFIELTKSKFPNVIIELATNCGVLNKQKSIKLKESLKGAKHEINVSHHGIDKHTFEFTMKMNYETSLQNLIDLIQVSDGDLQIVIRGAGESNFANKITFTQKEYLEYFANLAKKHCLNLSKVSIDVFKYHDRAGTIFREEREANKLNVGVLRKIDSNHRFYCSRLDQWLHIMWNGDYRLCCMDYHSEVKMPNIFDVPIAALFNDPTYRKVVKQVTGGAESPEDFICKRCTSPGG